VYIISCAFVYSQVSWYRTASVTNDGRGDAWLNGKVEGLGHQGRRKKRCLGSCICIKFKGGGSERGSGGCLVLIECLH